MAEEFSILTEDGIETYTVIPGLNQAAEELTNFIRYLNKKYPELSEDEAGWVAAYYVNNFPRMIEANPLLTELVTGTVQFIKSRHLDNG